jgi:outer membrane protein assembly factor BamE (lipoprotein component of BamABCDE complex)
MGFLVIGCSPRVSTHGDPQVGDRLASVVPGVHGRDDVAAILGSPSTVSPFDGEAWFYVSGRTETLAFLPSEEVDRQVVAVYFDQRGIVRSVEKFGKERGQNVDLVSRETPTFGTDLSLAQEFLGNLGRFNKEDVDRGTGRSR